MSRRMKKDAVDEEKKTYAKIKMNNENNNKRKQENSTLK